MVTTITFNNPLILLSSWLHQARSPVWCFKLGSVLFSYFLISSFNLIFTIDDIYSIGFFSRFLWQTFRNIFYKTLTLLKLIVFHWYIRRGIFLCKHRLHFETMNLWLVSFTKDLEHDIAIVCTFQLHSAINLVRILMVWWTFQGYIMASCWSQIHLPRIKFILCTIIRSINVQQGFVCENYSRKSNILVFIYAV